MKTSFNNRTPLTIKPKRSLLSIALDHEKFKREVVLKNAIARELEAYEQDHNVVFQNLNQIAMRIALSLSDKYEITKR